MPSVLTYPPTPSMEISFYIFSTLTASLRPTAPYSLHTLERDTELGWCGPGLVVVDTVRDVMTDGRFVSLNSGSLERYRCLDTTNSSLVAVL